VGTTLPGVKIASAFLIPCLFLLIPKSVALSVEVAPRITDREIVERLARLEEGQKRLDEGQKALNKRIDDLRSEMNGRFNSINGRFDTLQWTLGLFITIALVILGFVLRLQWQMSRRQTQMETVLETHREEIAFLKGLIEKLLPPRQTL